MLGTEPVFFWYRVTAEVLNAKDTIPVESAERIMADIRGSKDKREDLTREVGRGSSSHIEGFDLNPIYNGTEVEDLRRSGRTGEKGDGKGGGQVK